MTASWLLLMPLRSAAAPTTVRSATTFQQPFLLASATAVQPLSCDTRKRTWVKPRNAQKEMRWSLPAMVLLQASCGAMIINPQQLPIFRNLQSPHAQERKAAEEVYLRALQYLEDRGFGCQRDDNKTGRMTLKRRYKSLPDSCRKQMTGAGVHVIAFGLCLPPFLQRQAMNNSLRNPSLHRWNIGTLKFIPNHNRKAQQSQRIYNLLRSQVHATVKLKH